MDLVLMSEADREALRKHAREQESARLRAAVARDLNAALDRICQSDTPEPG